MAEKPHGDSTRAVRAGLPSAVEGQPLQPGPVFASIYHLPSGLPDGYWYGRNGNPTWTGLEEALGELDGGDSVVFASGMAALTALLFWAVRPGETAVVQSDGYFNTYTMAAALAGRGITVRATSTDGLPTEPLDGVRLVLAETPTNPGLDAVDVRAIVARAHAAGALVAVDNTLATPLGQRPLDLGADLVVASDTKALAGHSDVLLGHVTAADPEHATGVRAMRQLTGGVPGPMEAWLVQRSLPTLALRLDRQGANALALATAMRAHPAVGEVRYPGLPEDPAHSVAARQMRRFGGMFTATLADQPAAERFLDALTLVANATSFGGVHSTAERRARWGGGPGGTVQPEGARDVPDGLVRFSAGCEDTADLVADVLRALDKV